MYVKKIPLDTFVEALICEALQTVKNLEKLNVGYGKCDAKEYAYRAIIGIPPIVRIDVIQAQIILSGVKFCTYAVVAVFDINDDTTYKISNTEKDGLGAQLFFKIKELYENKMMGNRVQEKLPIPVCDCAALMEIFKNL